MTIYSDFLETKANLDTIRPDIQSLESQIEALQKQLEYLKMHESTLKMNLENQLASIIQGIQQASEYISKLTIGGETILIGGEPVIGIDK